MHTTSPLQSWVDAALRDQWEGSWPYAHRVLDDAVEQLTNMAFRYRGLRKHLAADLSTGGPDGLASAADTCS
ncbi:hypothetical protein GCM10017771_72210 [Streptomyces capitiformicae]|uniref:Uncharacterized protein n=1 Tax=Streptomyces capitiformicae TaxID=2014920 RepID=A0A919DJ87_9ACTN|nr:hypothetical protein GCM10017771_72210 [Streptomyces capitiformicae]